MTTPTQARATRTATPPRIARALACLDLTGTQRVLEVGCGVGHAAHHLLRAHPAITYTALDRSAHAVHATQARNADYLTQGRLQVIGVPLADLTSAVGQPARFDLAFAVNVNVFWTTHATREAATLAHHLAPGGQLVLLFDLPNPAKAAHIAERTAHSLHTGTELRIESPATEHGHLVIRAHRPHSSTTGHPTH